MRDTTAVERGPARPAGRGRGRPASSPSQDVPLSRRRRPSAERPRAPGADAAASGPGAPWAVQAGRSSSRPHMPLARAQRLIEANSRQLPKRCANMIYTGSDREELITPNPPHPFRVDGRRDERVLRIRPWSDDVVDKLGFDPRSSYVEETRSKWIFEPPEFLSGPEAWRWAR